MWTHKKCVKWHTFFNSVASFPGSPRTRTKNQKEKGKPGKIYHVRNVIGRENLWQSRVGIEYYSVAYFYRIIAALEAL